MLLEAIVDCYYLFLLSSLSSKVKSYFYHGFNFGSMFLSISCVDEFVSPSSANEKGGCTLATLLPLMRP